MKKVVIVLLLGLLALSKTALACSIGINDNFQKNLLVAHAANQLDISLAKVSQTSIADYSYIFLGVHPVDCPDFLQTSAKISFKYSPKKFQNCDASVRVVNKQLMDDPSDHPGVLLEELTFSEATAACSTSIPRYRRPCIPGRSC